MIDTHAHLNFKAFESDLTDVMDRIIASELDGVIVPGSLIENSVRAIDIAQDNNMIYAAVGVHPCHVDGLEVGWQETMLDLATKPKVVAIGEVGLDFIRRADSNAGAQTSVSHDFINIANESKLPIIFHSRESESELLDIIKSNPPRFGGVLHCFCATEEIAMRALGLGMMISFTGMITYPKNKYIREIASKLPHDRIMIETDSPYLPPQNKRGQRCEPSDVVEVAKTIGQLWNKDVEYADEVTTSNARLFFNLDT